MSDKGYSPVEGGGVQRTEMDCTECSKKFVAELDLDLSGNYTIECPWCGHDHLRKVEKGKITDGRWGTSRDGKKNLIPRSVWKSSVIAAQTSTVSRYLRERWLNRSDVHAV
jgi:DNA-directed RNA polymerase subunit RPC12/RpoP